MEVIKFKDLFVPFRGANSKKNPELTEKVVYTFSNSPEKYGKIPVLSGSESNEGVVGLIPNLLEEIPDDEKFIEKGGIRYFINNEEGSITMIRCGNAGKLVYRGQKEYPIFSLTTGIFSFFKKEDLGIEEKYKNFDGLNLNWFSMKFDYLFSNLVNQEGVATVPLRLIKDIELEIPKLKIQEEELKIYQRLNKIKKLLINNLYKLDKIKEKYLEISQKSINEVKLNEIVTHISRNDELSQEGIYKRSENLKSSKLKIKVLSGSFDSIYGIIPFNKNIHHLKSKQCLHVITRGQAGKIRYLDKGNYSTNTNAMPLILNKKIKIKLGITSEDDERYYLKFLRYYLEPLFLKYVSNADLSVLPLTEVLKIIEIPKFELTKEIRAIVDDYEKLETYYKETLSKFDKLEKISQKQIIFNQNNREEIGGIKC